MSVDLYTRAINSLEQGRELSDLERAALLSGVQEREGVLSQLTDRLNQTEHTLESERKRKNELLEQKKDDQLLIDHGNWIGETQKLYKLVEDSFKYIRQIDSIERMSLLMPRTLRQEGVESNVLVVAAASDGYEDIVGTRIDYGSGVTGRAAQFQHTVVLDDIAAADPGEFISVNGGNDSGSEIAIPLFSREHELVAVFEAKSPEVYSFSSSAIRGILERITVGLASNVSGILKQQKDSLTGLIGKDPFKEGYFPEEIMYALRNDDDLGLAILDLDRFKVINDTCGYGYGDEVIGIFGHALGKYGRNSDIIARVGGDEYVILLPGTGYDAVEHSMGRLWKEVQDDIVISDPEMLEKLDWDSPIQLEYSYGVSTLMGARQALQSDRYEVDDQLLSFDDVPEKMKISLIRDEMQSHAETKLKKMKTEYGQGR